MEEVSEPKKKPLVRASSEETSSDPSHSPSPGDTLPWNLPKHHRIKRSKSASGDVLDPAERAVIRIAGMVFPHRKGECNRLFFFSLLGSLGGLMTADHGDNSVWSGCWHHSIQAVV